MAPLATTFFFYFLSTVTVVSGVLVITRKNAVHSALALIVSLLGQAALYLMLYAPFVAGVQIILYAGGIMVLFLFVIMLVNIEKSQRRSVQPAVAGRTGSGDSSGALFVLVYVKGRPCFRPRNPDAGTGQRSGSQSCSTNYMFTFESPHCCYWWRS
jgi:NADH-quinone oxidoreductase subunit J